MKSGTTPPPDLKSGDPVVHLQHGIGLFRGLIRLATPTAENVAPLEREYLLLEYEGGDRLYVPVDQVDRVHRYTGAEGAPPSLSCLKSQTWSKTVARAQEQIQEIAQDLVARQAAREAASGHAYGEDSPEQHAMEAAFPYTETDDQRAAIEDVKRDLQAPRPMDRLVVGDVGYGKTEVAMRAAFKVATAGRQVAVLCPTAVLAAQHFASFRERMAGSPLRLETLSRLQSPQQQQEVLEKLRLGSVDILIGTHRLFSPDVTFKDLGLVIVDEEQRFGVAHKERLKELRQTVDFLTLTATPIPRTLHMALSGLRDLSLIQEPPAGRVPVETLVSEYDEDMIRDAIRRETDRGGQVYFLHNRVETLPQVVADLERLVPGVRVRAAHGQMPEDDLERTMLDFYEHRFDVLVCTTIIESGVDIPNANTILVDEADHLGLTQLYQIRGRVGRSATQAYAYLFYRADKDLTPAAEQRLAALRELSNLGSGYQIAVRDLEMRGAGNLLGVEQSGPAVAIGFDLYLQFLERAVRKTRGEKPDPRHTPLPIVDLPVDAGLPEQRVPNEAERLHLYSQLAAVRDEADVAHLRGTLEERLGSLPPPVHSALALAALRLRCRQVGIKSITMEGPRMTVLFRKSRRLDVSRLGSVAVEWERQGSTVTEEKVALNIASEDVLAAAGDLVETLAPALNKPGSKRRATVGAP